MIKTIYYKEKAHTSLSGTTFLDIAKHDKIFILNMLEDFVYIIGEYIHDDTTVRNMVYKPIVKFGKGNFYKTKSKQNNSMMACMCAMLYQHKNNPNKDFSKKQLKNLKFIIEDAKIMSKYLENIGWGNKLYVPDIEFVVREQESKAKAFNNVVYS